jgi:1-acyl-sn-glycerol-3-phosphate acyltransferase
MIDDIWTVVLDASLDSLFTCRLFLVQGMDMALSKLNSGGWVHIFPEGSRSRDGGKTIAPAKRGVGRLENHFPRILSFF